MSSATDVPGFDLPSNEWRYVYTDNNVVPDELSWSKLRTNESRGDSQINLGETLASKTGELSTTNKTKNSSRTEANNTQQESEPLKKLKNQTKSDSDYVDPTKPFLIIHIGPSKTGTSTIQRESVSFQQQGYLAADNYTYIGKFSDSSLRRPTKAANLLDHSKCLEEAASAWRMNGTDFREYPCWKLEESNFRHRGIPAKRSSPNII